MQQNNYHYYKRLVTVLTTFLILAAVKFLIDFVKYLNTFILIQFKDNEAYPAYPYAMQASAYCK